MTKKLLLGLSFIFAASGLYAASNAGVTSMSLQPRKAVSRKRQFVTVAPERLQFENTQSRKDEPLSFAPLKSHPLKVQTE